jgi:hypothetical protein
MPGGVGSAIDKAAPLTCGQTITTDTTLTRDLADCAGDGLLIGAANITIDLHGHAIAAAGWGVRGYPATIENGTILGGGVLADGNNGLYGGAQLLGLRIIGGQIQILNASNSVVSRSRVLNGNGGIFVENSPGIRIMQSVIINNTSYGISTLESGGALFQGNVISRNTNGGISTIGAVSAFINNTVSMNGGDGVAVFDEEDSSADVFKDNTADRNVGLGISMVNRDVSTNELIPAVDGGGNEASGNGDPRQCVALGLTCRERHWFASGTSVDSH